MCSLLGAVDQAGQGSASSEAAKRKAAKANRLPMLYADNRALETNLKVSLLAIREKELNYYVSALAARLP